MKVFYKIFNSILVLCLILVVLFLPLFELITTSDKINDYLTGVGLGEQMSFFDLKDAIMQIKSEFDQSSGELKISLDMFPETVQKYLTAFAVFVCITAVIALAALITGIFTKKKMLTASLGLSGLISTFIANFCFDKAAHPFISGEIDLISLYSQITGNSSVKTLADISNSLSSILGNASQQLGALFDTFFGGYTDIDIRILRLSQAYTGVLIVFGGIIAFNLIMKMIDATAKN